jgi:FdrA protein
MGSSTVDLRQGVYRDSVTLMQISRTVSELAGVTSALVAMATPLNIDLLPRLGFEPVPGARPDDLLVAVHAESETALSAALARIDELFAAREASGSAVDEEPPHTTRSALARSRGNLVVVSLPGQSALVESMDALAAGADVMLFSDNVSVEQEVRLKDEAHRRGLLVMGPDCGTAIVGGVGLCFANVMRPGNVGIVAASGTGAQQVCALLDAAGIGVSAVLGTGGRDLSQAVGARSSLDAMAMLDEHDGTDLVVMLSKPPPADVAARVEAAAAALQTPSVVGFLGRGRDDLTALTAKVLEALGEPALQVPEWTAPLPGNFRGGAVRGLYSGGTLCDEAMVVAHAALGPIASNIPLDPAWTLPASLTAPGHLMIDFGDDQLTQGRPHPMIDWTLRMERFDDEVADPECGVLLVDVVLGYGAHLDPAGVLVPHVQAATQQGVAVVVSLIGTSGDPQGLESTALALQAAGASVYLSNATAARVAAGLVKESA